MKGTANISIIVVAIALVALPTASLEAQTTDSSGGSSTTTDDSSAGAAAPESASDATETDETDETEADADGEDADALASGSGSARDDAPSGEEGDPDSVDADHDGSPDDDEPDPARSEEEAEAAQAATEPLAWRNSFFSWSMGSTFNTFYRGADLMYNPLYYWTFFLTPRWYLSSNVFFVVNQGLYYEFTDSDGAAYNREPQLYDTTIELRATFPVDRFVFIPAVRLTIPVSKLSQAAQRYFNTGIALTAVMNLPEVLNGNLSLALAYRRWWGATNVALTGAPVPIATTGDSVAGPNGGATGSNGSDSFGDAQASGTTLGVDRLLCGLTWNVTPTEGFTLTLSGFLIWDQGYGVQPVPLGVMGNPSGEMLMDGTSHWRMFSSYTFQAAYDLAPWFNLALGVANATNLSPFFAQDGSVLSPFNPNTQVFLSSTITLDGLYETIVAGGEEDGLTPEERQRRRQGLAALEDEAVEGMAAPDLDGIDVGAGEEDEDESGAVRATGTF